MPTGGDPELGQQALAPAQVVVVGSPLDRWGELRSVLRFWVLLLACCGGIGLIARVTGSRSPMYDLVCTIAMALVVLAFAAPMGCELQPRLSPWRVSGRAIIGGLAAWIGLLAFIHLYAGGLGFLGIEWESELEAFDLHGWPVWSAFVLISLCPAVFEEIAFRGIIYQRLERVGGSTEALVLQAAMFSILHLLPAIFISHFIIGLVLGWLRQRTGSLIPSMLAHGLYNASLLVIEMWT